MCAFDFAKIQTVRNISGLSGLRAEALYQCYPTVQTDKNTD